MKIRLAKKIMACNFREFTKKVMPWYEEMAIWDR